MIDQLLEGNKKFRETVFKQNFEHYQELTKGTEPTGSLDRVFGFAPPDRAYNPDETGTPVRSAEHRQCRPDP